MPDLAQVRARADQSDPDAQNSLGNAYTNALGVKQDYATALKWYRLSAEKGYGPAQFNLGLVYELGRGVDADERQAFKYYLMAAEQGFGPAQFNVGNMYSAGRGVARISSRPTCGTSRRRRRASPRRSSISASPTKPAGA